MTGPLYKHDCEGCRFLGTYRAHDLYFCDAGGAGGRLARLAGPTVIARYGNDGPDYVSGLALAGLDPILAQAFARAVRGYELEWISAVPAVDIEAVIARTQTELVENLVIALRRGRLWKALAKKLWRKYGPPSRGRHGCVAVDVRMRRRGR